MNNIRSARRVGLPVLAGAAVAWLLLATSGLLHAQAQAPAAAERVPVTRVVLYKSGIGYFEHLGRIRGDQTVTIDFTSGQLDDVLKSLTALDLGDGRVTGVGFNSEADLGRRLSALRLPLGERTSRFEFLSALRGAPIEIRSGTTRLRGRLLSVERVSRREDNGASRDEDAISIVTGTGELRTMTLAPGVDVRVLDADLNAEIERYLGLVASTRDQDVRRLTIATSGTGERDLFISYVSEVPVWKATYRLVLPPAGGAPLLQGWAIVDNTVGEDWENVQLSLVAGAPQSFVQQISRPYYVRRPTVPLPERAQLFPQTHQAAIRTAGAGGLGGTVSDPSGGRLPGVAVSVTASGRPVTDAVTDASGRYHIAGVAPGTYEVTFSLTGFRPVQRSGVTVSAGLESVLDATMDVGAITESVTVGGRGRGAGVGMGRGSAARSSNVTLDGIVDAAARIEASRQAQQAAADAAELGDLFEYKLREPVTIRKGQSALVPILSAEVEAERVSLWSASSTSRHPLRAVWLTNTTGLTLDSGSFSVVESQAFAGEGLIEPLKAGERRLLSFATDLGVIVDARGDDAPEPVVRVEISRGVVIQRTQQRQRRVYTARNQNDEPRELVIEHPVRDGWALEGGITPDETTPDRHRFRVSIAPQTAVTLTVDESRPIETRYDVSSVTDDVVGVLVREKAIDAGTEAALRTVVERKNDVSRLASEIASRETEVQSIGRDQERVRENMRSLRGTSEERQLLQRYVRQLDEQEDRLGALRREVAALTAERQQAQAELDRFIQGITAGAR
jgi:hypothetical protein